MHAKKICIWSELGAFFYSTFAYVSKCVHMDKICIRMQMWSCVQAFRDIQNISIYGEYTVSKAIKILIIWLANEYRDVRHNANTPM